MSEVLDELTSNIRSTRGSIAADKSHGKADNHPDLVGKRQNLAALRLEQAVRKTLATAPRPSDEQLQRIAALLRAGGGASPQPDHQAVVADRLAELEGGGDNAA
jgi:hypothetical protein